MNWREQFQNMFQRFKRTPSGLLVPPSIDSDHFRKYPQWIKDSIRAALALEAKTEVNELEGEHATALVTWDSGKVIMSARGTFEEVLKPLKENGTLACLFDNVQKIDSTEMCTLCFGKGGEGTKKCPACLGEGNIPCKVIVTHNEFLHQIAQVYRSRERGSLIVIALNVTDRAQEKTWAHVSSHKKGTRYGENE